MGCLEGCLLGHKEYNSGDNSVDDPTLVLSALENTESDASCSACSDNVRAMLGCDRKSRGVLRVGATTGTNGEGPSGGVTGGGRAGDRPCNIDNSD